MNSIILILVGFLLLPRMASYFKRQFIVWKGWHKCLSKLLQWILQIIFFAEQEDIFQMELGNVNFKFSVWHAMKNLLDNSI